jgi:hypothetical protein
MLEQFPPKFKPGTIEIDFQARNEVTQRSEEDFLTSPLFLLDLTSWTRIASAVTAIPCLTVVLSELPQS